MNAPSALSRQAAGELNATRFTVPGIKCAGCIAKIERELVKVDGIASARVNFSAKRVAIEHERRMDEASLTRALEQLGFEAQAVEENPLGSDDKERTQLVRALGVAGFGMMNIMLLSVSIWSGAEGATRELFHWLSAFIALPVIAYSGRPFFSSALMALKHGRTNMDVPISIGVVLATALSLYETATGGEHAYFESAVMLLFFLLAGRALDAVMRDKTRAGIGALLGRMGKSAQILGEDGSTRTLAATDLQPGMIALVSAGEALAADGEIIEGTSAIDNSMLTGESRPEPVAEGSKVLAGAINITGPIRVRLTATAEDTALADIARLMDEAGQSRSSYVRIADRASRAYAPAVHSLAAIAFAGWMIAGAGWHQSLVIAIAVLIITCPCAMGLAVPTAQVVASGALLKRGLLVKDGSALERLAECDTALMDKTGTLTLGEPVPQISGLGAEQQSIALALAQSSAHPLSKGLAKRLRAEGVEPAPLTEITEAAGEGMRGLWEGQTATLGRPTDGAQACQSAGLSSALVIGDAAHLITFHDPLRSDAAQTLEMMRDLGMEAAIVSGDRTASVEALATDLGINGYGDASPKDKLDILDQLKAQGRNPLMVGDGLNDGPALAAAHASIAPGTASDASKQAADAVFLGEKLLPVALAIKAARATMRIVRQNFGFSIIYNVLAVPLALFGYVTPLIAAIAMSVSSLVVVANSLRLNGAAK